MKTKLFSLTLIAILLTGVLAACGSTEPESAVPADEAAAPNEESAVATVADDYEDALTIRNQLLLGTLRLEGSDQPITAEQAKELLTLWQALAALSASGTAAPEETEAVQNQIMENLTPEQVSAIVAMRLTNAALQEFYVEVGLTEVKTPDPDVTPESTRMRDLSQEDREATRVASGEEPTGSGSGSGKSDALMDMVIELLENR